MRVLSLVVDCKSEIYDVWVFRSRGLARWVERNVVRMNGVAVVLVMGYRELGVEVMNVRRVFLAVQVGSRWMLELERMVNQAGQHHRR